MTKTFVKLETATPTKAQVDKGLNIVRDELRIRAEGETLKENKQSLHKIFENFFSGVPEWVNQIWNAPGDNPMSNTHYDVHNFARAYCGMLASPKYVEILEFTRGLSESKDKATFTIYFTDKKKGELTEVEATKDKRAWITWLSTQFTNRRHLICDKEREKKEATIVSEINGGVKRILKALENDKFKGQKSAKHISEIQRQIIGLQDYGINVTLK